MRDLGYNIQNMKVRSALTRGGSEMSADVLREYLTQRRKEKL